MIKKILAIETSCDDTSVAVVDTNYHVHSNIVSSQTIHADFGGVVPEIASRLHIKNIMYICQVALDKAKIGLDEIDAVAVSVNPGLIGALLVGVSFAKGLAYSLKKPLISVNHMLAHIDANKLENPALKPPYMALVVSGGHTEIVLFETEKEISIIGKTRDDAAGEAFDKIAKLLGLGYPGGPVMDKLAKKGNPEFFNFPRALKQKDVLDFSFSGLKTAVRNYVMAQTDEFLTEHKADIVAAAQAAIVDALVNKTMLAADKYKVGQLIVAGGVSANSELRAKLADACAKRNIKLACPRLAYCMDNAAMVGAAAVEKLNKQEFASLSLNAFSRKGVRYI